MNRTLTALNFRICCLTLLALLSFSPLTFGQRMNVSGSGHGDSVMVMIPARWEHIPLAKPPYYVVDFEGVLTGDQYDTLQQQLSRLKKNIGIEVFLVTVDTNLSDKKLFSDLGLYLLTNWFSGADSLSYGGLVLISQGLKKIKFFSNQRLEQLISEAELKSVIDDGYVPPFRAGKVYEGIYKGTSKLTGILSKNYRLKHPK